MSDTGGESCSIGISGDQSKASEKDRRSSPAIFTSASQRLAERPASV
ncbi:hypothetical protein [Streptomyces sp. DSM 40750]